MKVTPTAIADVLIIEPKVFGDARGFFYESFNQRAFSEATGVTTEFVQDNHSRSARGVLRGLHYQIQQAQGTLVRVVTGEVYDVAVDIRRSSPTYGKWVGVELSAANGRQLLVPKGFLHGFVTRAPDTEVQYKCTDLYAPDCDGAVRWDDPDIGIDWGLDGAQPVLSGKDAVAPALRDLDTPF